MSCMVDKEIYFTTSKTVFILRDISVLDISVLDISVLFSSYVNPWVRSSFIYILGVGSNVKFPKVNGLGSDCIV